jgi:cyclic-di-GMP phosphodiesterase TipF (flagellum assembly factor)
MASKDPVAPSPAHSTPRDRRTLHDAIAIGSAVLAGVASAVALLALAETGLVLSLLGGALIAGVPVLVHLLVRKGSEVARLAVRLEALEREQRTRRGVEPRKAAPLTGPAIAPERIAPALPAALEPAPQLEPAAAIPAVDTATEWAPWPSAAIAADEPEPLPAQRQPAEPAARNGEAVDPIKARRARVMASKAGEPAAPAPHPAAEVRPQHAPARQGAAQRPAEPPAARAPAQVAQELPVVSLPGQLAGEPQSNPVGHMIDGIAARLDAGRAESETAPDGDPALDEAAIEAVLERMVQAIDEGRVEVHLQPILTLADQQTVSYEAFARLRDAEGQLIEPALADALALETGLKREIDAIALFRAVHVLAGLEARGKLRPLFVNAPAELLSDGDLFREFVEVMKEVRTAAGHLVLELPQATAQAFGEAELESLATLSRLGFSLSLDQVTGIEMDFEPLIERGLAFVKVPAPAFARGLTAGEGTVATPDIGPMFEGAGLQLIVTDLVEEAELDHVLDAGIAYGQGALFAGPKPVKADVLSPAEAAA